MELGKLLILEKGQKWLLWLLYPKVPLQAGRQIEIEGLDLNVLVHGGKGFLNNSQCARS